VKAHATKLDPSAIATVNTMILTFERSEENAAQIRARTGLAEAYVRRSSVLINYDDWTLIHQLLLEHRAGGIEPMIPMISSSQPGALGIPHLPRLWIKALLAGVNALPEGWKTGLNCGVDRLVAGIINLDLAAAHAYLLSELPTYPRFEAWVREHIEFPNDAARGQWLIEILGLQKPADMAIREIDEVGLGGQLSTNSAIIINDLVDWKYLHDHVVSRVVARA